MQKGRRETEKSFRIEDLLHRKEEMEMPMELTTKVKVKSQSPPPSPPPPVLHPESPRSPLTQSPPPSPPPAHFGQLEKSKPNGSNQLEKLSQEAKDRQGSGGPTEKSHQTVKVSPMQHANVNKAEGLGEKRMSMTGNEGAALAFTNPFKYVHHQYHHNPPLTLASSISMFPRLIGLEHGGPPTPHLVHHPEGHVGVGVGGTLVSLHPPSSHLNPQVAAYLEHHHHHHHGHGYGNTLSFAHFPPPHPPHHHHHPAPPPPNDHHHGANPWNRMGGPVGSGQHPYGCYVDHRMLELGYPASSLLTKMACAGVDYVNGRGSSSFHSAPHGESKRKGGQIRFTNSQTLQLEKAFHEHKYQNAHERRKLALSLSLSDRQVKTWFQNRRAKWRKSDVGAKEDNPMERHVLGRPVINN